MSDTLRLDTDVASYLFKNSAQVRPFRPLLQGKRLALAFVSVAELFKWTVKRGWSPAKVAELEAALRRYLVIPYPTSGAFRPSDPALGATRGGLAPLPDS